MRIGAKLPNSGPLPLEVGIPAHARARSRTAGFDSLWVSDHIVFPREIRSRYPFAADGRATWADGRAVGRRDGRAGARRCGRRSAYASARRCWCCRCATRSSSPSRRRRSTSPAAAGWSSGVGAGWLEEEFDALGVPFASRGSRLDEWIEIAARVLDRQPRGAELAALRRCPTASSRMPTPGAPTSRC